MRQQNSAARIRAAVAAALAAVCPSALMAAEFRANYDESQVPAYTLPDPLVGRDGQPVNSVAQWKTKRRPEILRLFETEEYGRAPAERPKLEFTTATEDRAALGGKAVRKEVTIEVVTPRGRLPLHLLLYAPKTGGPVPVFLGLNFNGNQSVSTDPGIALGSAWVLNHSEFGIVDHRATEASRGCEAGRWQAERVIARGYAVASMCCGDIEPDSVEGIKQGVRPLYYRAGQTQPDVDEWGTVAAWAWGLSRALDYLETEPLVDAKRVAVWGHSRLGKTALWAAACDERFAMAISNDSGCGGAALSRRAFGETVARINTSFPHWFCRNFHKYNDHESELPIDQHELIALIAPRPVYVASAAEDQWADPHGEFLSAKHAEPVYELFGLKGLGTDTLPPVDHPVGDTIGYHMRTGKHDATAYDWQQYLAFADRHLRDKPAGETTARPQAAE
jgi:(4-O-methyl)-D-glucuronate---lignin esterase